MIGVGKDTLYGGVERVRDVFVFAALADSAMGNKRDSAYDFSSDLGDTDLNRIDANALVVGN